MTRRENERVIELFAGPGGMSEGLAMLGITSEQALGIEWDTDACATAEAAGHRRLQGDVSKLDPRTVARNAFGLFVVTGFHASPPCQGFSMAGKGKGREDAQLLQQAITAIADGHTVEEMIRWLTRHASDERTALTLEPLRWIKDLGPEWVTLEQVPAVLQVWEWIAEVLRAWGYNVATGHLQAEQYGVPQTRKRAILVASRVREVALPEPTHSKYHSRTPDRLDKGVLPWVSMAEALGWGEDELVGFPRRADGRGEVISINGEDYRGRDLRSAHDPSQTVTEKARSWKRYGNDLMLCPTNLRPNAAIRRLDQPAPTMAFGHETPRWVTPEDLAEYRARVAAKSAERENNQSGTKFDLAWPADRPAPTIAGREIVTMPGANANRFNGSTKSRNDGLRVTIEEAGVLQSFPADYPWQGGKTSKFQQCGNAVPPLLGAHVAKCAVEWASVTDQQAAA